MIYAIRYRQAVADVIAELNLTSIRESEATMTDTQSFRGSSHEVQKRRCGSTSTCPGCRSLRCERPSPPPPA